MTSEELNEVRALLIKELTVSETDFKKVTTLSSKLNVPEGDVRYSLIGLEKEGIVRRPFNPKDNELSWYRLTDKGLTRGEKRRRFFTMIGNAPMRTVKADWY